MLPLTFFRRSFLLLATAVICACSSEPDFQRHRDEVLRELRDPDSAVFRSEKVRTLWTKGGKRVSIYCAEVNSNNEFGGKTGFKPVSYIMATKMMKGTALETLKGQVFIQDDMSTNYYLDCIREDTERDDAYFGRLVPDLDGFTQVSADRLYPVLSSELAPELR